MSHSVPLIATVAAAFALALGLGVLALRLGVPAIVGYVVAGVLIGPTTPGFQGDIEIVRQLAEIGVMLLMFGVGLHLSLEELYAVRRIAAPGALIQITTAALLGAGLAHLWGWDTGAAIVFGLAISVASTVVLMRALESRHAMGTLTGRIAVGWLIVQDVVMVLVLVLLPSLATILGGTAAGAATLAAPESFVTSLAVTLGSVVIFIALMLVVGRRLFPWLLWQVARTGSRELFILSIIVTAVGISYLAGELFGVSYALGAFVAGLVLQGSDLSQRAADESLPLRDAFAVLFFVSVGMLFDPTVVVEHPLELLSVVGLILVGTPLVTTLLMVAGRYPLSSALTVGASLAQIGEFSFIVAGMGVSLGLLPIEGQNLILATAVITISLNPIVFSTIEPVRRWILRRSRLARIMDRSADRLSELPRSISPERLTGHVVIVGYGRVGKRIGDALRARGAEIVVAEENRQIVSDLRTAGIAAVTGNASDPAVLIQAHIARAKALVIATPDAAAARAMLDTALKLNPTVGVVVRTHDDDERRLLSRLAPQGEIFMGEEELARGMLSAVDRVLADTEGPGAAWPHTSR